MSEQSGGLEERLVFGVPAKTIVDALRGTGMAEADVIAVVGRGVARSAGLDTPTVAVTTPPFVFQTQVPEEAPNCRLTFRRGFFHPDFIDGVTVVQAGATPEEIGFNKRFHTIEEDLDDIADDLRTASNCMAELRLELFGVVQELQSKITEIDNRLDSIEKDKDAKEGKEKEKEGKDGKEKEKEGKDDKENKDKDHKEKDKESEKDKDGHHKDETDFGSAPGTLTLPPVRKDDGKPQDPEVPPRPADDGTERTFITLEERPEVGRGALADPDEER
jgi:hypothetical protein